MSKFERNFCEFRYKGNNPYAGVENRDPELACLEPFPSYDMGSKSSPEQPVEERIAVSSVSSPAETSLGTILNIRIKKKPRYTEREIEDIVRSIQTGIWRRKQVLWPESIPENPVKLLDSRIVLNDLGYDFQEPAGLGQYATQDGMFEVAGILDETKKTVSISGQPPPDYRAFTAAHELGHAVLHDVEGTIHRDQPKNGSQHANDPQEWEANKFATFFLMPRNLVRARFEETFGPSPFVLNDETAFALTYRDLSTVKQWYPSRRDLSKFLARTDQYNGKHIVPLVTQFGVSVKALAIRLEELRLV